jgi:hypothetical protein
MLFGQFGLGRSKLQQCDPQIVPGIPFLAQLEAAHVSHYAFPRAAIDDECGGASDRLQSIPAMLVLANETRRILLIKWNRPTPL